MTVKKGSMNDENHEPSYKNKKSEIKRLINGRLINMTAAYF